MRWTEISLCTFQPENQVERSFKDSSPIRKNTPAVLNFTELSGAMARETITISCVASPEPQIVTIGSDPNEPTFPYGLGNQHPIMPPSFNDLNLPHNQFNVLATMAVIRQDEENNPQSPDKTSNPSPISTPRKNLGPLKVWRQHTQQWMMPHFFPRMSQDGSTGIFLLKKPLTPMSPYKNLLFQARPLHRRPHEDKRESLTWGCLFLKMGECRSTPARHAADPICKKDTLMLRENSNSNAINQTPNYFHETI